jgi:uncharacterized protein (TIGR00725 family)
MAPLKTIIGVMGGGSVSEKTLKMAVELGERIAAKGWVLLNGGRNAGVMAASAQGAALAGGLTIGILPDTDADQAADHIQIAIPTGMGSARNLINVLAAHVVIACPGGPGTISEVALALKHGKPVICLGWNPGQLFETFMASGQLHKVTTPQAAVRLAEAMLAPSCHRGL